MSQLRPQETARGVLLVSVVVSQILIPPRRQGPKGSPASPARGRKSTGCRRPSSGSQRCFEVATPASPASHSPRAQMNHQIEGGRSREPPLILCAHGVGRIFLVPQKSTTAGNVLLQRQACTQHSTCRYY